MKLDFNFTKSDIRNAYGAEFCVKYGINVSQEMERQRQERLLLEKMQQQLMESAQAWTAAQKAASKRSRKNSGIVFLIALCITGIFALMIGWVYAK